MATIVDPFVNQPKIVDPFIVQSNIIDPFLDKKKEIKDPFEDEVGVGENIYRTAVGALRDVAQGTIDFTEWIDAKIPTNFNAGVVKDDEGVRVLWGDEFKEAKERLKEKGIEGINLPRVPEPEYFGGSFIRDLTGFVIPFSKLKYLKPITKTGKAAEIVTRGAIAEQLAFSPFEQRLSNLAAEHGPAFTKPLANYLKADPNDTESEARFKMALEGMGLGGTIESIIGLAKVSKSLFLGKQIKKDIPQTKTGKPITTLKQPDTTQSKTLTEKLEKVAEPIEDITQTSIEHDPGWLGKQWQKGATYTIDTISKSFPRYKPLRNLPDTEKYLKIRGTAVGKIEDVRQLARQVFNTFSKLNTEQNELVRKFLIKEADINSIKDVSIKQEAKDLRQAIDKVGNLLTKSGILSEEIVTKGEGSYLPRVFLKYFGKGTKMGYTIKKKELDEVTKNFLGEIKDVGLLGAKAITDPMGDIVRYNFFQKIAQDPNWVLKPALIKFQGREVSPVWLRQEADRIAKEIRDKARPDSDLSLVKEMDNLIDNAKLNIDKADLSLFKQLPKTKYYGSLRGAYVRKEIYNDIALAGEFANPESGLAKRLLGDAGAVTKVTKLWKMSKVAMNPPTQVRNAISNIMLLNLSGIKWRIMPKRLMQAWNDWRTNGPYSQIARRHGINNTGFAKQEMLDINKDYLKAKAKQTGSFVDKTKYIAGSIGELGTRSYQAMEIIGKTAKIIDEMSKGVNEGDAVLAAQKTLFDYSLIPPSVRYLRNAPVGMPFITFYYKVLPNILETLLRYPERYIPYIAIPYGLHATLAAYKDVTLEDFNKLKKVLPDYLKNRGNALAMPFKDPYGRWQFLDFSYWLPWSMFTGIIKDVKDQKFQKLFTATGLFGGPLPQLITAVQSNKDPFTQRDIVNRYDPPSKKAADIMFYLWRMAMPTFMTDIGFAGKLKQAIDKDVNRYNDPKISITQATLRLFGVNLYPIDPEKSRSQNLRFMKNEITGIKARRTRVLKDPNLTKEDFENLNNKYIKMIKDRSEQIRKYIKETQLHKNLK
jgi:hypothetical protein